MMSRFNAAVFHAVHSNGFLADTVYSAAYHFQENWSKVRNRRAVLRKVTPEELRPHRHLVPSSGLITGITSVCNAKCVFCAYPRVVQNKTLRTGVMSLDIFKRAVDEWVAEGGTSMDLTHTVGDALVDPGLFTKIEYAVRQAGIRELSLTTNGILLDRNDAYKRLVDSGMKAGYISTEGRNKELDEKL